MSGLLFVKDLKLLMILVISWIHKSHPTYYPDRDLTPLEVYHVPLLTTPLPNFTILGSGGQTIPPTHYTPDYRQEEILLTPFKKYKSKYHELNRPYRISPVYSMLYEWGNFHYNKDNQWLLACYCSVAYMRTIPLSGCVTLTTRHILTTAWPTDVILKRHKKDKRMVDILGWWYNTQSTSYGLHNQTRYMTPARIHFHPLWNRPETTNASNPYPTSFDLAIYTGLFVMEWQVYICQRGGSNWHYAPTSEIDKENHVWILIGSQFMRAYNRQPTPWHIYAVRTKNWLQPCPKVEWGWYHCVYGAWAPLGMDSGAALHSATHSFQIYLFDGTIGLNTISMKLRSDTVVHYFIVLNTHPVLDFLYNSYMGQVEPAFLDERYGNVKWYPLTPYKYYKIDWIQNQPLPATAEMGKNQWWQFWDGR